MLILPIKILKKNKYFKYILSQEKTMESEKQEVKLVDVEVTNENIALNLLVSLPSTNRLKFGNVSRRFKRVN